MVFCPYHNNHRTPSAEVNKTTGIFFCFSCQETATLSELVMHLTGRTYFESMRFIDSKYKDIDIQSLVNKQLIQLPEYVEYDPITIKDLHNRAISSDIALSYFNKRKISKESINKFLLGYSEKQNNPIKIY